MNIAYCAQCKPPTVLGAPVGLGPCSHRLKDGTVHQGKTLKVADDAADLRGKEEQPQKYLERLAKKYASKLT